MEIQERRLGDIRPYEKNPRRNDDAVKYVLASIKEFGFKIPIIIDRDGVIVAGHTRYKAAKELGMETVPCIVADDLTNKQIKAFRLADNKVAEKAEWDFELLNAELAEVVDFGIDIEAIGFFTLADKEADFGDFFEDAPTDALPKKEKEVQCPHCGMWFKP